MKKYFAISAILIVSLFLLVLLLVNVGANNYSSKPIDNPNIQDEQILSPAEAYSICNKNNCPTKKVIVRGLLWGTGGNYYLSGTSGRSGSSSVSQNDVNKDLELSLDPSTLVEKIKFEEKNFLLKGGIVEIEALGTLHYSSEIRVTPVDIVRLVVSPEDVNFIKEVQCQEPSKKCFDFSSYRIMPSEAYNRILKSKICNIDEKVGAQYPYYNAVGYVDSATGRSFNNFWTFHIFPQGGGLPCKQPEDVCNVSEDNLIFLRECRFDGEISPNGSNNCSTEKQENPTGITILLDSCKK